MFSEFLPSVIACACVTIAMERLMLLNSGVSSEAVMIFLANTVSTDLVRILLRTFFFLSSHGSWSVWSVLIIIVQQITDIMLHGNKPNECFIFL